MKAYKVAILTPYLTEGESAFKNDNLEWQKENAGLEDHNLQDERDIAANRHVVHLVKPEYREGGVRDPVVNDLARIGDLDLIITGSTPDSEREAGMLAQRLSVPVARFSKFHGGCSAYSGNSPAETGYSIDIPKKVAVVVNLLKDPALMGAFHERDAEAIVRGLARFNREHAASVLETGYLATCLDADKERIQTLSQELGVRI